MIEDFDSELDPGAFQNELDRFEKTIAQNENTFFDADIFEELLDHFMANSMHKKAMSCVNMAMGQYPFNPTFQLRKSQLLVAIGKWSEAFKILHYLESSHPNDDEVLLTIANIYSLQREYDKAILYYERALEILEDEQVEDIVMDLALEYENANQFDKAVHILESALHKSPENEAFIYELAYCYEFLEKPEKSIEYYNQFIDANPYSFIAWYNLGNAYYKLDQFEKAIWAYDYSIIINEEFKSAYFNKANVLMAMNDYNKAIDAYRDSLYNDQPDALTFSYIGECYEKLEDYELANDFYNKSIKLSNEIAEAWFGKGIVADIQGYDCESRNYLKRAVELDPSNNNYKVVLAESYEKASFWEESKKIYEEVIESDVADVNALIGWARVIENMESVHAATYKLESHVVDHQLEGEIVMYLSMLMWNANMFTEALLLIDQSLKNDFALLKSLLLHFPEAKDIEEIQNLIEINRKD